MGNKGFKRKKVIPIEFVALNLLGFPVVEMEDGKVVPFTSPENFGDPSVWWADTWEQFEDIMGILKEHPTARVFL